MPQLRDHRTPSLILAAALVACSITAAAAQSKPLPIREELRIGGEVADFTTIHWLGVSRTGTIIAAQRMDGNLRVFDASGRLQKVLGRPGAGPREFGSIGMSGWTGDSLWVHDGSLARLTFVRADVTLGEPRPLPSVPAAALPKEIAGMALGTAPSALYPDGSALFKLTAPQPEDADGSIGRREAYWLVEAGAVQSRLSWGRLARVAP
jgi:hypothetical protein